MAGTVAKRKSKGVVGKTRPAKHPRLSAPEDNDEDQHEENDGVTEPDQVSANVDSAQQRFKRASTPRETELSRSSEPDEYDKDSGRIGTQEFLQSVTTAWKKDTSKKRNKYQDEFQQMAKTQQHALVDLIKKQETESSAPELRFLKNFENSYNTILLGHQTEPQKDMTIIDVNAESWEPTLRHLSVNIRAGAQQLIQEFEACRNKIQIQMLPFPAETLVEKHVHAMSRILHAGRELGKKKIHAMLAGSQGLADGMDAVEANGIFYNSDGDTVPQTTWAAVVGKQEKDIRRIMTSLPHD